MDISNETILSICKSAAFGETAERTAEMHPPVTVEEVNKIWENNKEEIETYKNYYKELGVEI